MLRLYEEAMPEDRPDVVDVIRTATIRLRNLGKHLICTIVHGGHEYYRKHTPYRMYQKCLLCGKETKGWTLSPKRKSHL